jgi:hypothetical protein
LTIRWLIECGNHLEKHRLPSAILANKTQYLPGSYIETHILKSYDILLLRSAQQMAPRRRGWSKNLADPVDF